MFFIIINIRKSSKQVSVVNTRARVPHRAKRYNTVTTRSIRHMVQYPENGRVYEQVCV